MDVLQLLKCVTGSHHRSRKLAWHDGSSYRSWCTGCNKPMIRMAKDWRIDREPMSPPEGHSRAKRVRQS